MLCEQEIIVNKMRRLRLMILQRKIVNLKLYLILYCKNPAHYALKERRATTFDLASASRGAY